MITHDNSFLFRFRIRERVFLLTDDEVQELKQAAAQGDAYAQYGYGRWIYYHNTGDASLREAEQLFLQAKDTVPDALAAYAQMWRYGETQENTMDVERSRELLRTALARGSQVADIQLMRAELFGTFCEANPAGVAAMIERRAKGCQIDDPVWFVLLAYAYEELDRREDAIRSYEQAIKYGETTAYAYLAMLYFERGNMALYEEMMEEGIEKGCALCMIYQADMSDEDFEELSAEEQQQLHNVVDERLRRGLQLGEGMCAYFLFNHYYYGGLGYTTDNSKAFAYLEQGARLGTTVCMTELAIEAQSAGLPGRTMTPGDKAELWLKAARYLPSDEDTLYYLQRVSDPDFLLRHKDELERYWQPRFKELPPEEEAPAEDEPAAEETAPVQRKKTPIDPMVIVIWPTGHMDLERADVYKMPSYREMGQRLINADGLDAVHYSPLLASIAKEAELDLDLVMYCDRDAVAKNLPDNPIGTQLYSQGEIRGPIIICQEDPIHDCHSFKTLEDLVGTYNLINSHTGGLLIIKDEDDGRYDAWA